MSVSCGSCGRPDDTGSAYCLDPTCGVLLAAPPETTPQSSARPGPATLTVVPTPVVMPAPSLPPTPAVAPPGPAAPTVLSRLKAFDAVAALRRLPGDARTRWLTVAVTLAVLGAVGMFSMLSPPKAAPNAGVLPTVPVVWTPAESAPTPLPVATTPPPPTTDSPPDATSPPGNPPRTTAKQTTAAAAGQNATQAKPAASLTVSTAGSHCTGWYAGHGWTIAVDVTVHNGVGTSATGWHGKDKNVGPETFSLSGSGTHFSGELPPNLGDNPELTDSSVAWSVTVKLSDGTSVSTSGLAKRPANC